jgi:hypothetical protein
MVESPFERAGVKEQPGIPHRQMVESAERCAR